MDHPTDKQLLEVLNRESADKALSEHMVACASCAERMQALQESWGSVENPIHRSEQGIPVQGIDLFRRQVQIRVGADAGQPAQHSRLFQAFRQRITREAETTGPPVG